MRLRHTLLAATMLALPLVARAEPIAGLYISGGAGVNIMQDETIKSVGGVATPGATIQMDVGAAGVGAVGWGFGNGVRAEFEFDYRYNGVDSVTVPPFGKTGATGSEQKYGPMVNIIYDFNGLLPTITPYIGVGAGYQWAHLSGSGSTGNTKGSFAAQAILGGAMAISAVPGLALTLEYRFMALPGDRSYSGVTLTDDFNHSVMIGLRYQFGVAAPAPAPMPVADMGAKTFLVFFDWDRADLTARSQGIIRDASAYSTSTRYTRIDVDGNTDTSGTPSYNQGLSERRARVVASELVRDGVPQAAISMHAFGDTHLLVPTGPNVREPQNRRVEIVYH